MTLNDILRLQAQDADRFIGHSPEDGWRRVFGGLVVAQALVAASETVEGRVCHSLHAYFLRPGDPLAPLTHIVERTRDGSSFATRRVTVRQGDKAIFEMIASFQTPEAGLEHQVAMPSVPPPEDLRDAVWMPANFRFSNGGEVVGLIPTRYPDTNLGVGDALALARRTEWREGPPGVFTGLGQRLIATDGAEVALMDLRAVVIDAAG